MIIKQKSGLNFELNKENFTAKVVSSPFANGDVFIPSFLQYKSQNYYIKTIGKDSFRNNFLIRSISFPEDSKVDSIEADAFFNSSIYQIYIPPSLEDLNEGWCRYTIYLTKIIVSPNNKRFLLLDNHMIVGKSDPDSNNYDVLYFAPRNIKEALIPSNIKLINSYAFANCFFLSTINFASNPQLAIIGNFAFSKTSIEHIIIPDQVKAIQKGAFFNCAKLLAVDISKNSELLFIEEDAFFKTKIERIYIPSKLEELREGWCRNMVSLIDISISEENDRFSLFDNDMLVYKSEIDKDEFDVLCFASRSIVSASIPSTIKYICSCAFQFSQIQIIEFSEDSEIEVINKDTFSYSKITEVLFPKSVKIIKERAFSYCKHLSKIEFPENSELRVIESHAFSNSSIQSINIPSKFVEFRGSWCSYTPSLYQVTISPNNRRFGNLGEKMVIGKSETNDDDFDSIIFASRDIKVAIIPSNIKYIASYAFSECYKLEKVEIRRSSKLEIIEYEAFSHSSIKSIYIPRYVMRIGRRAFYESTLRTIQFSSKSELQYIATYAFAGSQIKSIFIPATVTTINGYAFESCRHLQSVDFSNESELSIIGKYAFSFSGIEKIIIPKNVESVLEGTFDRCYQLKSIKFSENSELRRICKNAFSRSNVSCLYIPSKVKILKDGWCINTIKLYKIYVSPENKFFMDIDGQMVVRKSNTKCDEYNTLYFVSRYITEVIIPSYIKKINSYCFYDCNKICSFKFSKDSKLESISKKAFPKDIFKNFDFDIPKDSKITDIIYSYLEDHLISCRRHKFSLNENSKFTEINYVLIKSVEENNTIYIPPKVKRITETAFISSTCINIIKVSPNNKYFKDINGQMLVGKSDVNKDQYDILYFVSRDLVNVTIPSFIKKINPYSFSNCNQLQNVEFESNSELEFIGQFSFENSGITTISIPDHVRIIDDNAFKKCINLSTIIFSNESELQYIGRNAFYKSGLIEITIPKNVEHINENTFSNCFKLEKIEFAEGSQLKSIKENALSDVPIHKLNFPSYLNELNLDWIGATENLSEITFSPENVNFKMLNEKIVIGKTNYLSDHYDTIYFASRDIETAFIPSYIKRINKNAFAKCIHLQKIEFEENSQLGIIEEKAFMETSFTEISLPESVQIIKEYAFLSSKIQKIVIPSQITKIFASTFEQSDLAQVEFSKDTNFLSIGFKAFYCTRLESITIPSSVRFIDQFAFSQCQFLNSISFEENSRLHSIGSDAFSNSIIDSILIPDNIESIDNFIFTGCFQLESIKFSENSKLTKISSSLLNNTYIKNICIPPKVEDIDQYAFSNAYNLVNVSVSPNNKYFKDINGQMLVGKSDVNKDQYDILYFVSRDLVNVTIPSFIKKINPYSFSNCNQLQSVEFESNSELEFIGIYAFSKLNIATISIPDHVQTIDEDAFDSCINLTNVNFSSNSELKIIGKYSFAHTGLEKIAIPKSVEHIHERAFSDDLNLEVVEISEDSELQSIGKFVFSNTPVNSLYIPSKVNNLEEGWCRFTPKLNTVLVSPNNKQFASIDGKYVYGKSYIKSDNFDILIFASRNIENVFIGSNITTIGSYAFNDCCIETIKFAEDSKLQTIENESFSFSTVKNIDIPKSTKVIESYAFMNCTKVRSISVDENSSISIQCCAFLGSSLYYFSFPKGCKEINQFNNMNCVVPFSVEFLGDDLVWGNCFSITGNAYLLSMPNATRVVFEADYLFSDVSIFIAPMAEVILSKS